MGLRLERVRHPEARSGRGAANPPVMLMVSARLRRFDCALEEPARDLGATYLQTFGVILQPDLRPTILASFQSRSATNSTAAASLARTS